MRGVLFHLLLWMVGVAGVSYAQAGGTLRGQVVDQTGAVLPGVTVEFVSPETGEPMSTVTGSDGGYQFGNVGFGEFDLIFRLVNFTTVRQRVTLTTPDVFTADARLSVAASADITITARRTFRNLADLGRPAENLVGVASAASEGAVTAEQITARPIMRAGEVLETVPGLIISQHSGEGKANQYYLRGFNLDHGTDFASTVAGIPVNMPTHAHGHGYADANFLIPELVSGVQFRKGPYYADEGDFSSAGASNVNYVNVLDRPIVELSGGTHGWGRFLGAASPQLGDGYLLAALELNHNDGPWVRPDDFLKANGVLRYSRGDAQNGFSLTGLAYSADWNATDQIPRRAVESGLISRFGHIDPTDSGRTYRYGIAADLQTSGPGHTTRMTGYVQRYGLNLFQNFTYFLDDPVRGDQFEQEDRRWIVGGQVTHRRLGNLGRYGTETAFGIDLRYDAIGNVGLYRTSQGQRVSTIREDGVGQFSAGMFAETEVEWNRVLRTTLGLRGDVYGFRVDSIQPLNSGAKVAGLVSPKVSVVLGPWADTEVYVNLGLGFHSNDGRGSTIEVDPITGEPVDAVTPLVRARGAEFGVRTVRLRGLQTTVSIWMLGFDSELLFVGDAGTTEAGRPSRRYGVEITNYARPLPWLTLDLDLAFSRARFTDPDPYGDAIPGALDRVISAGASFAPPEQGSPGLFGSVRVRHFGERPLVEDERVTSPQTTLINGELGYRLSDHLELAVEGFNLLDSEVSDIDYFYTSRLPGEPAEGVDDVHTHPALPRSTRATLRVRL